MMLGALDIGGTKTLVGLVREDGSVAASIQFPTDTQHCLAHLALCAQRLKELAEQQGLRVADLAGVGATVPGIVDEDRSVLVHCAYPDWNGRPVKQYLQELFPGCLVAIENDVNACAIAELKFGKTGYHDFLWVTVSTGVGGAVVCGGKLIRGQGSAGEFGHIKVEYETPCLCPSCGGMGCLEAHGSGKALQTMFAQTLQKDTLLRKALEEQNLSADGKGCEVLALQGYPGALHCMEELGKYLGRGLGAAINVLNPQAVILGGEVAHSLPLLYNSIMETFGRCVHRNLLPVELLQTKLGYQAALVGAAALLLEDS